MKYRPWGPIDWVLSLSTSKKWHFVGALGTEERSICSWAYLRHQGSVQSEIFAEIHDVDSEKYREENRAALKSRNEELLRLGGKSSAIRSIDLMAELFQISSFAREAEASEVAIILDITSFPKRFLFPILRRFMNSGQVRNLILTYTSAAIYPESAPLYENIESWKTLPGFGGTETGQEMWIVSIGFLVESLRQYIGDNPNAKMKILIPFPAHPGVLRRTWASVANLEQGHPDGRFEKYRVDSLEYQCGVRPDPIACGFSTESGCIRAVWA